MGLWTGSEIAETAAKGGVTFQKVLELSTDSEARMHELGRLRFLCANPVVTVSAVGSALSISAPTANALATEFVRLGLLKETTGYARNHAFSFDAYLRLFLN